jgi:hypothetical protein
MRRLELGYLACLMATLVGGCAAMTFRLAMI